MAVLRDVLQAALGDGYTLERELVGGGMSTVFVARDNALDRRVVVKVLPYEMAAVISVDRFKREIMLSAALQHPHVVPVLQAGECDGLPYFIMPFVEGESLRARLARGPLSVRETVSIFKDVARALGYAHGRGIIHRDIKPDNVLISAGSATVTDFGVAKAVVAARGPGTTAAPGRAPGGTITLVGTSIGTPAYMAPEQAAGDPDTDHRADIYALGIVAYEMLVGAPPFHGRSPQHLLAAQLTEKPAPIGSRRYDVPEALANLVMSCLEKEPANRPQSATELVRALEDPDVVSGTFSSVRPAPRARATSRILLVMGAAALSAATAFGFMASRTGDVPAPATLAGRPVTVRAIAVLPLVNIGRDSADVYLAEGMTTEITTALSRIPGLRVASRTAAGAVREHHTLLDSIGRALNVELLLEGTVQRDGDRMRVTARLVNVADGFTVWSDMYERDATDLFAVQDDIARSIVDAIAPELIAADSSAATVTSGTADIEAYDLYLRGRFFFQKRGEQALRRALDFYRQAAARDTGFARAHAGIADALSVLPLYADVDPDSVLPEALAAVNRAVALDSMLPDAYASRAVIQQTRWRWADAERDFRRALALDPNSATGHQWYGEMLLLHGRIDEARAQLRRAAELDPVSPVISGSYALALAASRQPEQAVIQGRRAVDLDSTLVVARFMLGSVYIQAGRLADARQELEQAFAIDSASVVTRGLLGYVHARLGDRARAARIAQALEETEVQGAFAAAARVHLGLGQTDRALDLLERAVEQRDPSLSSETFASSFFAPLRGNARFDVIVSRIGLDRRVALR